MSSEINKAIISSLKGEFTHSNPFELVEGLTAQVARKKPDNFDHSCWDLLYHVVTWQTIFLTNLRGEIANWKPKNNWPPESEKDDDKNFEILLNNFKNGMVEIKDHLKEVDVDFEEKIPLFDGGKIKLSNIILYFSLLQHLSYHMGQLAVVRKLVDNWKNEE